MLQFAFHLFGTQSILVALETLTGPSSGESGSHDHSYLGQLADWTTRASGSQEAGDPGMPSAGELWPTAGRL